VATDKQRLFGEISALLDDSEAYARMSRPANPYDDGHASRRIAEGLIGKAAE
jgi:UDP-N-acetylglucosamine 2-epimerase (non-hydrolysing)